MNTKWNNSGIWQISKDGVVSFYPKFIETYSNKSIKLYRCQTYEGSCTAFAYFHQDECVFTIEDALDRVKKVLNDRILEETLKLEQCKRQVEKFESSLQSTANFKHLLGLRQAQINCSFENIE